MKSLTAWVGTSPSRAPILSTCRHSRAEAVAALVELERLDWPELKRNGYGYAKVRIEAA